LSLQRRFEGQYGNDPAVWIGASPTPGTGLQGSPFPDWIATQGLPEGQRGPGDDPDRDGRPNLLEFALGSHPMIPDAAAPILLDLSTEPATVRLTQRTDRPGVTVLLETTPVLGQAWTPVPTEVGFTSGFQQLRIARQPTGSPTRFFRLSAR